MNPNLGWNCGGRVLQRTSLPLHNHSFGINWYLAAGMTGRHPRLSAMLSHVMATLPLGFSLRETEQQTRHRRRPCPQQDGTQHNGSSYAVHFHESISLSIARQHIDYTLAGGCDVTSVTISYPPGNLKKPSCRTPPSIYANYLGPRCKVSTTRAVRHQHHQTDRCFLHGWAGHFSCH